jgi:hypothetical protein
VLKRASVARSLVLTRQRGLTEWMVGERNRAKEGVSMRRSDREGSWSGVKENKECALKSFLV